MNYSGNQQLESKAGRPFLFDYRWIKTGHKKPLIIFLHGFKGFKDWGHFNLIADKIASAGMVFLKLNFSHNGTTPNAPIDFEDLEAFGNNNFTKEQQDISTLLSHLQNDGLSIPSEEIDYNDITILGHSKGGSAAIIAASKFKNIKRLITWSAVANLVQRYTNDEVGLWKEKGVMYIPNSRTNQEMPLYYQLAEDVLDNLDNYDITKLAGQIDIPWLILHGEADSTVDFSEAKLLNKLQPKASIQLVEDADHTFGGGHPWEATELPLWTEIIVDKTINFIQKK